MAAEDDDTYSADHGKAQAARATACRQVVQDDFYSREFEPMGQDLGFPYSQIPEMNPIGYGEVIDPKD